jgi:hypothetical protein
MEFEDLKDTKQCMFLTLKGSQCKRVGNPICAKHNELLFSEEEHENLKELLKLPMKLQNDIIIIIGAYNDEPHVIEFARKQQNKSILCIRKEFNIDFVHRGDKVLQIGNNAVILLEHSFNSLEFWKTLLSKLKNVKQIIVDQNTTKFMNPVDFSIVSGKIMHIILSLLDMHGTFLSHCCSIYESQDSGIKASYISNDPLQWNQTFIDDYKMYGRLNAVYNFTSSVKSYLKHVAPVNYKLEFKEATLKNNYPLIDYHASYPYEYLYMEKVS